MWISELWSESTDCIPEPRNAETREQVLVFCPHDTENPYQAERSNRLAISTIHPQLSRSTGIATIEASSQTEERRSSCAHQTSLGASDFQVHAVKPEQVFAPVVSHIEQSTGVESGRTVDTKELVENTRSGTPYFPSSTIEDTAEAHRVLDEQVRAPYYATKTRIP